MSLFDERKRTLREFFGCSEKQGTIAPQEEQFNLSPELVEGLARFNIEWHLIPSAEEVPLDDAYMTRLYPAAPRDFNNEREHGPAYREHIIKGHQLHQGR